MEEQLANLRKSLDSYFKKLSQLFEKSFVTCSLLKHLLFNSRLGFNFNLESFTEFQENCLDTSFFSKINEFVDREFFLLGDLHFLFDSCNEDAKKSILYFLENSFQQNRFLDYNDYIKITEKAVYFNWLS